MNNNHLQQFKWLGISKLNEPGIKGVWCVFCAFFKTSEFGGGHRADIYTGGQKMGKLITAPLTDYSELTGKSGSLSSHQCTNFHRMCAQRVEDFLLRTKPGSFTDVQNILVQERKIQCLKNRAALRSIIETILLCGRQNIALRGHRDDGPVSTDGSEPDVNDGNFRSLLRFRVRAGDEALKEHLRTAHQKATYTSKTIQNEILVLTSQLIIKAIVSDVKKAVFFSVLADETQDRAKREQLVIVVRYAMLDDNSNYILREEPIKMLDLVKDIQSINGGLVNNEVKLSGEHIGKSILNALRDIGLNLFNLVGQGYDGASAMASERIGVAATVKEQARLADYYHCAMHCLNLSASQTCKVPEIRHCLDVIREMCTFFKYAKRRTYLEGKIELNTEEIKKKKLVTLCQTRFVERHESVMVAKTLLPYVVASLDDMTTWDSYEVRMSASSLLNSIRRPKFLIGLVILEKISSIIKPVSSSLQAVGADLFSALADIDNMLKLLQKLRAFGKDEFNNMYLGIIKLAERIGIDVEAMNRKPRVGGMSLHRANAGEDQQTASDYYRINIFYPLLDAVITDIKSRFGPHQKETFTLSKLLPQNVSNSSWQDISSVFVKYSQYLDIESIVEGEYMLWQHKFANYKVGPKEKPTAINALNLCEARVFPNISKLLKILCVLPVSTAEPERYFSKLEKTLSCVRASMGEERLESLIMLQVHRSRTPTVDDIINYFADTSARKSNFIK